jgi:HemY protein
VTPKPQRPFVETLVTESETPKKPEAAKQSEPHPFFGGLPDDPGVRNSKLEPAPKTRLRLF